MKQRIKKKLSKKQKTEALSITNVIGCKPTTCKVLASKETLVELGIDLDLTNVMVEHIRDFKDGYSEIRIKNEELSLQELADLIGVSKSGIRNRFRRLEEIYNNLENKS